MQLNSQPTNDLTAAEQKRGIMTVMIVWFLMHAGFFLIIPLLSVHFVDNLGWAAAFIGVVLAVRQFTQQGLTVFGGALADRVGPKPLILLGVLIRALSFVIMGFATVPWLLLLSAFLAAIGGALFDAPQKATLAAVAPPEQLTMLYGRLGILQNVARGIGPLVGALLLRYEFQTVGLGAAAFFGVAFLTTWFLLPPVRVSTGSETVLGGLGLAVRDRPFVLFTILMMGFWFMWVQLSIAMPLRVTGLTGDESSVGILFAVAAVLSIVLQVPALKAANKFMGPNSTIVTGMVIMAAGLFLVGFVDNMWQFYGAIFFFSLGTVLVMPNAQTVIADMADPRARGAFFGLSSLALAVGGGIGHVTGGSLVDLAMALDMPALPWLLFAAVGLLAALGLAAFTTVRQRRLSQLLAAPVASGD